MTPFGNKVVTIKDEMYQIVRTFPESQLNNPDYNLLKEYFKCDNVFRNKGIMYFCRHIPCIDYKEIKDDD